MRQIRLTQISFTAVTQIRYNFSVRDVTGILGQEESIVSGPTALLQHKTGLQLTPSRVADGLPEVHHVLVVRHVGHGEAGGGARAAVRDALDLDEVGAAQVHQPRVRLHLAASWQFQVFACMHGCMFRTPKGRKQ